MAGYIDNVSFFYKKVANELNTFAFLSSRYTARRAKELCDDFAEDSSVSYKMTSEELAFNEKVSNFIANLVHGAVFITMLPLCIPNFCIALIIALPLGLIAPVAFLGAAITDAIVGPQHWIVT